MQLFEYMRPFVGDMASNPSSEESSRAYRTLAAYIFRRHVEFPNLVLREERIYSIGTDLKETLYLDVNGKLAALCIEAAAEGETWHSLTLPVADGEFDYHGNTDEEILRRIDRDAITLEMGEQELNVALTDRSETRQKNLLKSWGSLEGAIEGMRLATQAGLNNQPVFASEIEGIIAILDHGQPVPKSDI